MLWILLFILRTLKKYTFLSKEGIRVSPYDVASLFGDIKKGARIIGLYEIHDNGMYPYHGRGRVDLGKFESTVDLYEKINKVSSEQYFIQTYFVPEDIRSGIEFSKRWIGFEIY